MMTDTGLPEYHPYRSATARDRYIARYDERAASWPVVSEAMMVDTPHGETLVRTSGLTEAPPLVLLPGAWTHSLQWPPTLIEAFSKTYRTYSIDNVYDLGRSVSSRPAKTTADHMAWLDELLDAIGLVDGVNLFGCSRGGWLSAEYVLHAPHRLAKTIWLSPGLVVQRADFLKNAANGPRSLAALRKPSSDTVGAMMRWLMPEAERCDKMGFDQYVDDVVLGLQCYAKMPGLGGPRVFSAAELGRMRVPVLYMAGADEKLSSVVAAVSRLKRVAPQIETAVFPGVGHGLVNAQPAAVAERALQFLDA